MTSFTSEALRPLGALERLFAAYGLNGAMVFAVPLLVRGRQTEASLTSAMDKIQKRHRLLDSRIGVASDGQQSFLISAPKIRPRMIEGSEGSLPLLLAEEVNTPFDALEGPLMRLTALVGETQTILVGTFHHSIADGRAGVVVMMDLLSALGGEELPVLARYDSLETLLGRDVPKFPREEPLSIADAAQRSPASDETADVSVHLTDFSDAESAEIFGAAKRHGVRVHSALTVAFARTLLAETDEGVRESVRVMSPVDLARTAGHGEQMGVFVSIAVQAFDRRDTPFWEAARIVNENLASVRTEKAVGGFLAAITSGLQTDENLGQASSRLMRNVPYDSVMTNLGMLEVPESFGDIVLEKIWAPALRTLPGQDVLAAATVKGKLGVVHTGAIAGLSDLFKQVLLEACRT